MKNLLSLLLLLFLFNACHKDSKIEKTLYKKGGKWEIVNFSQYQWMQNTSFIKPEFHCTHCGAIEFKKDGSGTMTLTSSDGQKQLIFFKYKYQSNLLAMETSEGTQSYEITWNISGTDIELNQTIPSVGYVAKIRCKRSK